MRSGWRDGLEVNDVAYDPRRVTLQELESALKKTGTLIRRLVPK